jgi:hypothetical protein
MIPRDASPSEGRRPGDIVSFMSTGTRFARLQENIDHIVGLITPRTCCLLRVTREVRHGQVCVH